MLRIYQVLSSLRLTVVLLVLAAVLVFAGTLAQVEQGLYQAQARYFRSLLVYWSPADGGWKIPVFPGGYLIGALMVVNLVTVTIQRLRLRREHFGLLLVHAGLVLLFLGQLFTDLLSVESALRFEIGETRNYSEDFHANELVLVDTSDPARDTVVSIPERVIARGGDLKVPGTPLTVAVQRYWANAELLPQAGRGAEASLATHGAGRGVFVLGKAATTRLEERNLPAALLELRAGGTSLGAWLVAVQMSEPQTFEHAGRTWQLALRPRRHYTPFSLTLLDCQHDVYQGTDIPRNFSSRVRVLNPTTGEDREVLIYMNNPLRYGGNTYYQYQMDPRQSAARWSTLQVVRNPSWLTPYISCLLVGVGLSWQFLFHLVRFLRERRHES